MFDRQQEKEWYEGKKWKKVWELDNLDLSFPFLCFLEISADEVYYVWLLLAINSHLSLLASLHLATSIVRELGSFPSLFLQ